VEFIKNGLARMRGARQLPTEDHVEYQVKTQWSVKDLSLTFDTRQQARDYRRLLAESRHNITSEIWRREFTSGFMTEEKIS